ncbi:MAG: tetratricopeptide repeat protein [Treponema sp.]|nr:tetratricopeptide repeat protein [Treponema sp.]
MKLYPLFIALFFPIFSCTTAPADIPEDTPPTKIIQRAQEAMDTNKYPLAVEYYQILQERYGDIGEYYCTAEYEISFIRYKQKRYAEARRGFENLLALYSEERGQYLPPRFKVLAEKVLLRIDEKER